MELVVHGLGEVAEMVEVQEGETRIRLLERLRERGHEVDAAITVIAERDAEGDLEDAIVLVEVLGEGAHVHARHRDHCERVELNVRFLTGTKRRSVRANSTVGKALEWATAEFEIIPAQRPQYRLKLPTATGYLENETMFGELLKSQPCALSLDLVRFEQNAGAEGEAADEQAVKRDLEGVAFLRGVTNGRWREPKVIGKHVFIKMATSTKSAMIGLRLDITGYPDAAPQGVFWDLERNERLADGLWPVLADGNRAFRTDWAGGLGFYIACDRSALVQGIGHPEWATTHTNTNWRPNVGIARYLSVVADLLAMATMPAQAA